MQIRTPKEIGLLVRDQRKRLGLTQDGLARRLGTSRLWVLQLEQGKPTVQLGMVIAALNDPFAAVAVCSVTFHLKSVQVLGVGMSVDDVQFPISELLPAAVGSVEELRCSKPAHPIAALAATEMIAIRIRFFMGCIQ